MKFSFYILPLLILANFSSIVVGQSNVEIKNKVDLLFKEREYDWKQKQLFFDLKINPGFEITKFPEQTFVIKSFSDYNGIDSDTLYGTPINFNILNFSSDNRINIRDYGDKSIFIKIPTGLGFSISSRGNHQRSLGFVHFHSGVYFGFAQGLNSTFNNSQDKGYNLSIGFQYFRSPVFGHNLQITPNLNQYIGFGAKRNWVTPCIQFDRHYTNKLGKIDGISLTLSVFPLFHFRAAYIIPDKK